MPAQNIPITCSGGTQQKIIGANAGICGHKYPYSSNYHACYLAYNHSGLHNHIAAAGITLTSGMSMVTSPNDKDDEPVAYGPDGRPLPLDKYRRGYEHCSETSRYEHHSIVVSIKGAGSRVIWPGKGDLGFIYYTDEGLTVVRIYKVQTKTHLSTHFYNGTMTREQIRAILFDTATPSQKAKEEAQKGGKPFKATFRHIIMPKAEFDKKFKPNTFRHASYHGRADDTALKSLGEMLRSAPGAEIESGHSTTAINSAMKGIRGARQAFLKENKDVWPAVEVYAIWQNYDMDAKLIYSQYDASEPLLYQYHVFTSAREMDECVI